MFDNLTGLGYGIIVFAITIGIGAVVLTNFGDSVANCATGFNYSTASGLCQNDSLPADTHNPSDGAVNVNYLNTQLGQGGLAGWTPAIIALSVGLLFLGALIVGKGNKRKY